MVKILVKKHLIYAKFRRLQIWKYNGFFIENRIYIVLLTE